MRLEVVSLLEAHHNAGTFLEQDHTGPATGEHIGPYKIRERIGQGGMGAVYRASRDDGQFEREVAIKFVEGQMFAPEAERRFITERHILARLNHPAIVRMFDGDVWQGRRYLVMELVTGKPITEYCKEHHFGVTQRLALFQQVSAAIQYAHQNLIIHRDLKAADILVTVEGQVKVLDFGIARLLDDEFSQAPNVTGLHPMTLSCASPEQVRGEPLTVATDIYSLGLLLYELLSEHNPQSQGTRGEIIHRILHDEPSPPSKLAAALPRDLDAIVLKALSKNANERYVSAADMSADIENFQQRRPVSARRPSLWYTAKRFCSRNPALTIIGLALIIAVVVALLATLSSLAESRRGARRFNDVRGLAHSTLFDVYDAISTVPGSLAARRLVASRAQQYLDSLSRDAGDPDLASDLAESYLRLGDVRGRPYTANLGDTAGALDSYQKARRLVEQQLRRHPDDPGLKEQLARACLGIGQTNERLAHAPEALQASREAVELARQLYAAQPTSAERRRLLSQGYVLLSETENLEASQTGSVAMLREALNSSVSAVDIMTMPPAPTDDESLLQASLAYFRVAYRNDALARAMGDSSYYRRALDAALQGAAVAREPIERQPVRFRRKAADSLGTVGLYRWLCCHDAQGALRDLRSAEQMFDNLAAGDPQNLEAQRDVANNEKAIGTVLAQSGHIRQGVVWYRKAIKVYELLELADPPDQETAHSLADARRLLDQAEHAGATTLRSK